MFKLFTCTNVHKKFYYLSLAIQCSIMQSCHSITLNFYANSFVMEPDICLSGVNTLIYCTVFMLKPLFNFLQVSSLDILK